MTINPNIFNTEKTDYNQPSLFMGQKLGLVDSINKAYPEIFKLYKKMKSLDWDENEFDFSGCNVEFKTCTKSTYEIMIRTLAWQWEADSVAATSIMPIVAPFVTSSELWAAWGRISDNECLVEGTQVLTPGGWVDLAHVTPSTQVAQYEPATSEIKFVYPTNFIEKDYEGVVYEFKNDQHHFHQVVTPGHRMLKRKNKTNEYLVELAKDTDYCKGAAGDGISAISSGFVRDNFTTLTSFERLLIAIQADGAAPNRYTGERVGTVPVFFTFAKQRKIDRLKSICEDCGIELIVTGNRPAHDNFNEAWIFKINLPTQYRSLLKNFNWVDLSNKGRSWCEAFLEEIVQWDGHFTKNTGILVTTSRQAVEVTQAVASMCGMKTHLGFQPDNRSENFTDCWRLSWKRQDFVSGQTIIKTEKQYFGKVRCVTVPSGFFLVRYKDAVSVTGNCVHALTYSEMVRNSFDDPSEVLEDILSVRESIGRVTTIAEVFGKVHETSVKLSAGQIEKDQNAYNDIYLFVVALYCLERIQFIASFAVTFAVANTGQFVPFGKAVQKICQDEFEVHQLLDRAILDYESKTTHGQAARIQNKEKIQKLVTEVIETELTWVDYLLSEGRELVGMTPNLLKGWVLYNAKEVLDYFDIEHTYDIPAKNPIPFVEDWIDINRIQASPQQEKNAQYMVGMVTDDISDDVIDIDL